MDTTPDILEIEKFLSQYDGGEIFLSKQYWEDGIVLLCIQNSEKKNAISGKMMVDFRKCVLELQTWHTGKAVIVYGCGTNFCSGGDLNFARNESNPEAGFKMCYYMQDILKKFRQLPFITISLLHGPVLGGGAELSVFSDFIFVTENVHLGFVHAKMGIITAWGGASRLFQILDQRKALEMLTSSKLYNAQECLDIGIAYKIVQTNTMLEETIDFVRSLTTSHYSIIQSYKKIGIASESSFSESLNVEKSEFYPKWGSQLNKDALNKRIKHIEK